MSQDNGGQDGQLADLEATFALSLSHAHRMSAMLDGWKMMLDALGAIARNAEEPEAAACAQRAITSIGALAEERM